ncbi:MAG: hypothetical protein KBS61_02540 [Chryseobacterium sp.]|nr:hypothetical protein [Candidatus Chryseobacterium enterohippi]
MKNILFGILGLSLAVISCKKDEKPTLLKDEAGNTQPAAIANTTPQASLLQQSGIATQNTVTPVATPAGMNPPHGEPGHRCDIPVGQPLNSTATAPTTANNNTITVPNQAQTIQIDPNALSPGKVVMDSQGKPVKTAPGMNPPHGEPGHRCDIQVGQPLNSKPAAQPTTPQPHASVQPVAPAPQPIATTGPKPKLNPAHGEPFHDCAKQVGEAL